jgi:hypothetical protein
MPKTKLFLAAMVLAGLTKASDCLAADPPETAVEANRKVLLETIQANRKALIAVNLALTDQQAAQFWPIYERYQKEIGAIGDRVLAILREYETSFRDLSNEKALELIQGYLAAEAERAQVRLSFVEQFAQVLPGRVVARFYQIDNKMDAVLRYDLAATIPVVEPEGAAQPK